jgi:hypothetical protein
LDVSRIPFSRVGEIFSLDRQPLSGIEVSHESFTKILPT